MTEFERGALFALELLRTQLNERSETLQTASDNPNQDKDVGFVLRAADLLLSNVQIRFEAELMKRLNKLLVAEKIH